MGAIINFDDLGRLRNDLPGKKIVLGTGCFDLLHVGHLYFLQEARRQGDVLIVGLNSDKAIKAIKGPDRPIFKQEERVELIAAFEGVDMAFIFDDVVADSSIRAL
jgi:D-beta-D-heptose 7-phosphate kinase/D-beta-D-heptose 1-phosphate adenosyltransferase